MAVGVEGDDEACLADVEHVAQAGQQGGAAVRRGDVEGIEIEVEPFARAGERCSTVPSGESLSTSRMSSWNPLRARIVAASSISASTASIEPAELYVAITTVPRTVIQATLLSTERP